MPWVALAVLGCTALSGLVLLSVWLSSDEVRSSRTRRGRHRRLSPGLVISHVSAALAAAVTWADFVLVRHRSIALTSVVMLLVTVAIGATMFVRWVPSYREHGDAQWPARRSGRGGAHRMPKRTNLPITAVIAHGFFAMTTAGVFLWIVAAS